MARTSRTLRLPNDAALQQLMGRAKLSGLTQQQAVSKALSISEHDVQASFIKWVRLVEYGAYPELSVLFAVPNGGKRGKVAGAKLKREGVLAGVADILLPLVAGADCFGLAMEWKRPDGTGEQSPAQKLFEKNITRYARWRYVIVNDLNEAIALTRAHVAAHRSYLSNCLTLPLSAEK